MPDFSFEDLYDGDVCGLDEVGRGPIAGPVVAACVMISPDQRHHDIWRHVNDSKMIAPKRRVAMATEIKRYSTWAIAECSVAEIDTMNILQASLEAMRRALMQTARPYVMALVDGNRPPTLPCAVQTLVKGDQKSVSIAAASIIAKVYRDDLMQDLAAQYPHYGWHSNAGYPSPAHLRSIEIHGITPHHRQSFAPIRNFLERQEPRNPLKIAV